MYKIMISPGIFLYYSKKYNIVNIKILTFLLAHFNSLFFKNSYFSSSSTNAK